MIGDLVRRLLPEKRAEYRWGKVESVSPLQIRMQGPEGGQVLGVSPVSLVNPHVGDTVRVAVDGHSYVVDGIVGGPAPTRPVLDTRDANQSPAWYYENYPRQVVSELKRASAIGLTSITYPTSSDFVTLETTVPWSNATGGSVQQEAVDAFGSKWRRYGDSETWQDWMIVAESTPYRSFTPQLSNTSGLTSAWGRWIEFGALVHVQLQFVFSAASTVTGDVSFSLPTAVRWPPSFPIAGYVYHPGVTFFDAFGQASSSVAPGAPGHALQVGRFDPSAAPGSALYMSPYRAAVSNARPNGTWWKTDEAEISLAGIYVKG